MDSFFFPGESRPVCIFQDDDDSSVEEINIFMTKQTIGITSF